MHQYSPGSSRAESPVRDLNASVDIPQWIRRAREADREAIDLLCALYLPLVVRYVHRWLGPTRRWIEPDDVANQVVYEVLSRLSSLDKAPEPRSLLRLLNIAARSRVVDAARKYRRETSPSSSGKLDFEPAFDDRPSTSMRRTENDRMLRRLVRSLPSKYSEIIRLKAFDELSCKQVAQKLDLSTDTVHKRYERARHLLHQKATRRSRD